MGAGKTTVGRLLAERIGWDFLDLDALHRAARRPLRPGHLRRSTARPTSASSSPSPRLRARPHEIVLALGGGAPEVLTNRLLLEQTPATATVFLDAPFPALYRPLHAAGAGVRRHRPARCSPTTSLPRLASSPASRSTADSHSLTVPTAGLTCSKTADAVLARA